MTKVRLQPGLLELSGGMGEWVYRTRNGKTSVGMKPRTNKEPSQAQMDHRERFKQAAAYGRLALADQDLRPFYEEISKRTGQPVFSLIVADFLKPPTIATWDGSEYQGQIGDVIHLTTLDDVGAVSVQINVTDEQGVSIESGYAVETLSGSGSWLYTAKTAVPAGKTVTFNVVATDRPGGTAVYKNTKTL
jgi:hypothetical protein